MQCLRTLIISITSGLLGGTIATLVVTNYQLHDTTSRIEEFYATENVVHVSPHGLRTKMEKGISDFTLVDLRSQEEYEKAHISGAVSIPAYKDPATPAYDDVDRIVGAFLLLPKDKPIIVYCYSIACMTGRKIGKMLSEHNIFVQHLGIGWNEWRYAWKGWNHESEWSKTKAEDYVSSGSLPGKPNVLPTFSPCTEGQFGC